MQVTWLGQAGLLFETGGQTIVVDPYLSNSVAAVTPAFTRRVPVDERFLRIKPDVIVLTHDHLDHTDPQTLAHYLNGTADVCVLASGNAWKKVRELFPARHNYVQFDCGTEWTQGAVRFTAVRAVHSDPCAIGVVLDAEGKRYYITGDTLYSERILRELPDGIDCVFLPVNGVGNNMNLADARRFCRRIGAKAVPLHFGLFDALDGNSLEYDNKVVPSFFRPIDL